MNPKISVIVLKKYRNKGVGYQVIKEWANVLYKESDVKRLDLNNDMGNVQGKKCFHKLGAILNSNYDEEYYRLELPIK